MWCTSKTTLTFSVMYISPLTSEVYLLVNVFFQSCMLLLLFSGVGRRPRFTFWLPFWLTFFQSCMLPLFFSGLLSYLVGIKRRTSRRVGCKRQKQLSLSLLCTYLL